MAASTPLMEQYDSIKAAHQNEILFFRLGDFYEMFDEDAREVSRLLSLTLTHRAGRPMCGIPYHANKVYIARLLRLGKRIAICEQVTLPGGKGLAERKVVEVVTPGTALEDEYLETGCNNYFACLCVAGKSDRSCGKMASFASCDVSTGDFYATSWPLSETQEEFSKELGRANPKEIIISTELEDDRAVRFVLNGFPSLAVSYEHNWHFSRELAARKLLSQFGTVSLRGLGLTGNSPEVPAAGFLVEYLARLANPNAPDAVLPQVTALAIRSDANFVGIDDSTRRNLEITENLHDGGSEFTLFETLRYTCTAMGTRLLRSWLAYPLVDAAAVKARQDQVALFTENVSALQAVRSALSNILDVERLASKVAVEKAHAKDLVALKNSLLGWLKVREAAAGLFLFQGVETDTALAVIKTISRALLDEPSTVLTEGGMIRGGYSKKLDQYRAIQGNFSEILDAYLEEEKRKTGISNMKVKYQRNFGYYLEVTRGKLDAVPPHFILRRSLTNGERYTSPRLKELEGELLNASDNIIETEKQLFLALRREVGSHIRYFLDVAREIATVDVSACLAEAALAHRWCRPLVDTSGVLEIVAGRHPVVEQHLDSGSFVPNDTNLSEKRFALITGPNMAGKSTYLRQNALIVLLAQIGSFVPAEKAHIGVVDKIFCRVGASDNLARGESTFLVEMSETARILRSATEQSLVVMDEVGRGTSTEDGLSIAWAVSEYLLSYIRAKTFFATHYHELTRLNHDALALLCMDVLESDGETIFLKKVKPGASANSYGIHVARLAGIPQEVIERAEQVLGTVQESSLQGEPLAERLTALHQEKAAPPVSASAWAGVGLFPEEELVLDEILSTDVNRMTPLGALEAVSRWKNSLTASAAH